MALVGKKAPAFSVGAVINGEEIVENFSLDQYLGKKNVILFFYPKDFTFVCPTELHAFQSKLAEFEKRDTVVIGCSTDTEETHLAWLMTAKAEGGIEGVSYPILAGEYSFDAETRLWSFAGAPVAYRGTFLIDKEGVVRHESINDLPLGRNIDEYLRLLDAQIHVEKFGEVCPANWEEGKEAMQATNEGVANYLSNN